MSEVRFGPQPPTEAEIAESMARAVSAIQEALAATDSPSTAATRQNVIVGPEESEQYGGMWSSKPTEEQDG